jgi:proliferating cell nuclear antigen
MFEATISNAGLFKNCVEAISTLIDEGEFVADDSGMKLRAMDPSQIAMVDFELPKKSFEKYKASDAKLGVNMQDLVDVMNRVRTGEKLEMTLDETKSRLVLVFKGESTRRFVVPLLDLETSTPKTPSIEFETNATLNGSFLKESLKDTSLVSSHVILESTPQAFLVQSRGDRGEVKVEAKKDSKDIQDYKPGKGSKAMFPLEYLNDLLKNADSSTNVHLSLKSNAPLKLNYNIGDAKVTYFLAPRIEEE